MNSEILYFYSFVSCETKKKDGAVSFCLLWSLGLPWAWGCQVPAVSDFLCCWGGSFVLQDGIQTVEELHGFRAASRAVGAFNCSVFVFEIFILCLALFPISVYSRGLQPFSNVNKFSFISQCSIKSFSCDFFSTQMLRVALISFSV